MFRGANKVTLDAKGRVAMPARYRDTLVERSEGRLVATVDRSDKCLLIYPLPDWEEIERKLMRLPTLNPQARRLQRAARPRSRGPAPLRPTCHQAQRLARRSSRCEHIDGFDLQRPGIGRGG